MKSTSLILFILFVSWLQSCGPSRRFGTTIERDENNPCQINIIIQVALEGTDADVQAVKNDLEACYSKQCFIPCDKDSTKGCMTKTTIVVKKYGELKEEERDAYHYVYMVDNDGLPSNAYLGTPNAGASSGTWRRNAAPRVYCHEVLHFCGLEDKYCSRIYDPVKDSVITELTCNPPPEPNGGNCCTPSTTDTRCSTPCDGHDHNLMATVDAHLSCQNILDIVKKAGLDNCPEECCASGKTFTKPPPEIHVTPGYLHFGDKNTSFGAYGASTGISVKIKSSWGVGIDAGYYMHTEKDNTYKETSGILTITGGVKYTGNSPAPSKLIISGHAMAGIASYSQKVTFGNNSNKNTVTSAHLNIGAALDLKLNRFWNIRLLQLSYAPTFFYETTQHNFKANAGIVYKLQKR